MSEIWKPYPANPHYAVSDQGRVRREATGHIFRPCPQGRGYLSVSLCVGEPKPRSVTVHRMVWETFRGPIPPDLQIRHGPNGKLDNRLSQLDIGTAAQNAADRIAHGTQARGRAHGRSAENRRRFGN